MICVGTNKHGKPLHLQQLCSLMCLWLLCLATCRLVPFSFASIYRLTCAHCTNCFTRSIFPMLCKLRSGSDKILKDNVTFFVCVFSALPITCLFPFIYFMVCTVMLSSQSSTCTIYITFN